MLRTLGKKAQTTAEYAILIAIVVGAVVAMQVYVRRGLQGRVKDAVDHVGTYTETLGEAGGAPIAFSTSQYEPYYQRGTQATNQDSNSDENLLQGGGVTRTSDTDTAAESRRTIGWQGDEAQTGFENIPQQP